ncbi:MAG: insulinase family protein [Candidatus Riflebacteria bacterium]|nr:insulinase family protein [Candidatus Riflebacteria bacterium]
MLTKSVLLWILSLSLSFGTVFSAIASEEEKTPLEKAKSLPKIEFEKFVLPNGLQVILHIDRKLPIVHVNEWVHVGSKNEKPGKTGFAHLFEHLMFQGSKNAPGGKIAPAGYFNYIEKAGANVREGGINGTTGSDRTNFFDTVPSGNLEYVLWLESDRLATLIDYLDQKNLDNQREVVRNERRMGLDNAPYGRIREILPANLYPPTHPYSWPVIGSHEDLINASLEDVKAFFKQYYTPNNISLVIAGDFDPAEAKKLVAKYYGCIPSGPPLARPRKFIPSINEEKIIEVNDRVPQTRIIMVWPSPAYFDKDDAELDLASLVLSNGLSSRLTKELVYDKQLCTTVSAVQDSNEISGEFAIEATLREGSDYKVVEKTIDNIISELAKNGPTKEELERIKTRIEYIFVSNLEKLGGFGGKADQLNQYNTYLGDPGKFEENFLRYQTPNSEDVKNSFDRWINNTKRLKIRFFPEPSGRVEKTDLDRGKPPAFGSDKDFEAPTAKSAVLENGLEVIVIERNELPKVAVGLSSKAGSFREAKGKEGLANLTMNVMRKGSKTRKALEIDEQLSNLGTSLGASCGRETAILQFEVLKRNLEPAMEIVADVVMNPAVPEEEIERERKLILGDISQMESDPVDLSSRLTSILAFGKEHPYGHPALGFTGSVKNLNHDDVVKFHDENWVASGSYIVFAGQITLDEAKQITEKVFKSWKVGNIGKLELPEVKPYDAKKIYVVDRQDSAQTHVNQVLPGPKRADECYYPLSVADTVWGSGGFGTRLTLNIRENKGFTYNVRSALMSLNYAGCWIARSLIQGDKTKEAMIEFIKELEGIGGKKPITSEEFSATKERKLRGFAQGFEKLSSLVSKYSELKSLNLPLDELNREYKEVKGMELEKVNKTSSDWAKVEKSFFLLVGDYKKIEHGLKELNFGDVVLIDKEGNPLK